MRQKMSFSWKREFWLGLLLCGSLSFAACGGNGQEIATPKDEIEANKIVGLLNQYNINATTQKIVTENGTTLQTLVNTDDRQPSIQILNDYFLPRKMKDRIDMSGQMPLTGVKEKLVKEQEAEEKIENMVLQFPGLVKTTVKVDLPDTGPKIEPVGPSVTVHAISVEDPPQVTEKQVRELLRTSVNELKEENLSIIITVKKPLIPLPSRQPMVAGGGFWPARNRLVGIGAGVLVVGGAVGGVWWMRKRRQNDWEEEMDESEDAMAEVSEDTATRQLPSS